MRSRPRRPQPANHSLLTISLKLTDEVLLAGLQEDLRLYPAELLAAQRSYPDDYLATRDTVTQGRRLTGITANDCHDNMVLVVTMIDDDDVRVGPGVDAEEKRQIVRRALRPGVRAMTQGRKPGDELARVDLDSYW